MESIIKIALVGAGMFGGDVHAQVYAGLQRVGIGPQLSRVGLDGWLGQLAGVKFELAALATRTEQSAQAAQARFRSWSGHAPRTL